MRTQTRDGAIYASYEASFDPAIVVEAEQATESKEKPLEAPKPVIMTMEEVKTEVTTLNQRWKGWIYKIPEIKLKNITKPKADLYTVEKDKDTDKKSEDADQSDKAVKSK